MARPKKKSIEPKRSAGRPRIEIDEAMLKKLSQRFLKMKDIANILGIHPDTLRDNYSTKIEIWQSEMDGNIATCFLDEALNKREPWALKLLAQKRLGYSEKIDHNISHAPLEQITDDDLDKKIQEKLQAIKAKK